MSKRKSRDSRKVRKMIKYSIEATKYAEGKTIEEFLDDERDLVYSVFNLSQVGELVGDVSASTRNKYNNIPWRELRTIRNRIVHDYKGVKSEVLWHVITVDMKKVIGDLELLVKDLSHKSRPVKMRANINNQVRKA